MKKNISSITYKYFLVLFISANSLFVSAQKADEAYLTAASSYISTNQNDKAIEHCNKALAINPSNATAYNYRGVAYRNLENNKQALLDFNQAIHFLPTYDNAYLQRALVYKLMGNKAMALADDSKAISLNPKSDDAYLNRGNLYYDKESYSLAIFDFTQAIKINSKYPNYYLNRGRCYAQQKNYDLAITDYTQAIVLLPDYSFAFFNRGIAYERKGNKQMALDDYNSAIKSNPNDPGPYKYRADLNYNDTKYQAAIDDYSTAIKFDAKDFSSYLMRANAYAMTTKYSLALQDLNLVVQADPLNTDAYITRGWVYAKLEKYDEAIQDYNTALIQSPKNPSAIINRGWAYKSQGKYDLAMADFEMAIQLDPKNADGYSGRGTLRFYKGEPELAMTDLNKSIELNPLNGIVYGIRSSVNYFLGNYAQAISDNKEAIRIDATDPYAYIDIITNLIRIGDIESAKTYYQKYKNKNLTISQASSWKFYDHYVTAMTEGVLTGSYDLALKELKASEEAYSSDVSLNSTLKDERKYGYVDVLFLEGYVLEKLEKYSEAKVVYEQAMVINKNQPDLKTALQRIEDKKVIAIQADNTPPEIQLISPQASRSFDIISDKQETEIVGKAKDPSGISEIKINGTTIKSEEDGLFVSNLSLKPGDNVITITATDKHGNMAAKTFTIAGNAIAKNEPAPSQNIPVISFEASQFHAILIGENNYQDPKALDLKNPVNDAKELQLILQTYYTFNPNNIDTLFNQKKYDILNTIMSKCKSLKKDDNLIIFFAGHGIAEKDKMGGTDGYWIPVDAKLGDSYTYISADEITKALKNSDSKHILLIADACYSGSFTRGLPADASVGITLQYSKISRKIMTSGNLEAVPDDSKFVYYLKKNLKENTEKYLTSKKLFDGFYEAVINNTENLPQYSAVKNTGDEGGEFVFIKK